jgi:hypothetical protein
LRRVTVGGREAARSETGWLRPPRIAQKVGEEELSTPEKAETLLSKFKTDSLMGDVMRKVMFRLARTCYLILPAMLFANVFQDANQSCVK